MLHIAGASLSCPHNFFNEKASILHAAPKKFGGRTFLRTGRTVHIFRARSDLLYHRPGQQRPHLENSTAESFTCCGFNNASWRATTREVRLPNFSTTTFSTKFSQKLPCPHFEMCATMRLWSNLPPTHRGKTSISCRPLNRRQNTGSSMQDRTLYSIQESREDLGWHLSQYDLPASTTGRCEPVIGSRRFISAEAIADLIERSTTTVSPSLRATRRSAAPEQITLPLRLPSSVRARIGAAQAAKRPDLAR